MNRYIHRHLFNWNTGLQGPDSAEEVMQKGEMDILIFGFGF